jgi:squalene synthase HpnC
MDIFLGKQVTWISNSITKRLVRPMTSVTRRAMSANIPDTLIKRHATASIADSFKYCEAIARKHYENFPVASHFIPRDLRPYVFVVYAFARTADDFADEGAVTTSQRLANLSEWESKLERSYAGDADHPVFIALQETISRCGIPKQPLADLLMAFKMDVTRDRFSTFEDLLHYCAHSANPVGRLVLHIFSWATDRAIRFSDDICTGLQLANFWQDVAIDWAKGRLYLPLEDINRFGYTEDDLARATCDERFRDLLRFQVERTRAYFNSGRPLLDEAVKELKFELRLTWHGGMTILKKIERANYDVLTRRPVISSMDKAGILIRTIAGSIR